jgi:transposase
VLGASSYTYAEASWTQSLPDWIGAHVRALAFLGSVPRQIVPDNLKAGVLKANWYEPGINPTYQDLASHYGTAILPARPRKPRDEAKVDAGVLVVERWILARLRHQRFFALAELNAAIATLLADLNDRPMRHLAISRRRLFEGTRPPGTRPAAARAPRLRRMVAAPDRTRLSRRRRRPLCRIAC